MCEAPACHASRLKPHRYLLCVFGQLAQLLCSDLNGHTQNSLKMSVLHSKAAQWGKQDIFLDENKLRGL